MLLRMCMKLYTLFRSLCHVNMFVNFWFRMYCIYNNHLDHCLVVFTNIEYGTLTTRFHVFRRHNRHLENSMCPFGFWFLISQSRWWIWYWKLLQDLQQRRVRVHQAQRVTSKQPDSVWVCRINMTQHRVLKCVATKCKIERKCGGTRCNGNEPRSESFNKYGETCCWGLRHHQYWLPVASRIRDICRLRPTHGKSVLRKRQKMGHNPGDGMDDPDKNLLICARFMSSTLGAAGHLGKKCLQILHSVQNQEERSLKQLLEASQRLIKDQHEIQGVLEIRWQAYPWWRTSLLCDKAVRLSTAKVHVFLDSVVCLGRMGHITNPMMDGKTNLSGLNNTSQYRELFRIDGKPMESEWTLFPGFIALQILAEIQSMMSRMNCELEQFTSRIIFMSMCTEICMERFRKQKSEKSDFHNCVRLRKEIPARSLVVPQTKHREGVVRNWYVQAYGKLRRSRWDHDGKFLWKWTPNIPWNKCFGTRNLEKKTKEVWWLWDSWSSFSHYCFFQRLLV